MSRKLASKPIACSYACSASRLPLIHLAKLRVRVELTRAIEQPAAASTDERRSHEHERHFDAARRELRQLLLCLVGLAERVDRVLAPVALDELCLDLVETLSILVDRDEDRQRHREPT
jgi:hypothetical protein